MQRFYRRFIRAPFVYADLFIRLLGNPAAERRAAVVWGYAKLRLLEKLTPGRRRPIKLLGFRVSYGSVQSLRYLFREMFVSRLYAYHAPDRAKRIIDAGANIGISMLYFKYRYPEAKIVCFEPDPETFRVLEQNIADNGLADVEAHNTALAAQAGTLTFYYDRNLPAGDVAHSANREFREALQDTDRIGSRQVRGEPLAPYLKEPIDILKIDVEGAETAVLRQAAKALPGVEAIMAEYHYAPPNTLSPLLELLEPSHHYWIYHDRELSNQLGSVAMVYARRRAK